MEFQGKEAFIADLALIPNIGGTIGRYYDLIQSDERSEELQEKMNRIIAHLYKDGGLLIDKKITELGKLFSSDFDLRKPIYSLAVIRLISIHSAIENAKGGEIEITVEELMGLFQKMGSDDPKKMLGISIYELENEEIITKAPTSSNEFGIEAIYPSNDFFFKTDALFHDWNPKSDALALIKKADADPHRSYHSQQAMEELGWSVRRMNSALKCMEYEFLVKEFHHWGDSSQFFSPHYELTDEADFFLEENSAK